MPKRIEYAPTIESMSGDLSAPQKLVYARNNNQAYDSPMNQRNYARNYHGSIIARRLNQQGRNIFAVKGRSAVGMTLKAKQSMAYLAGAGAIYGYYITSSIKQTMQDVYAYWVEHGHQGTFRQFWFPRIYHMVKTKTNRYFFSNPAGDVWLYNPWATDENTSGMVSDEVLVRYWSVLAPNANTFMVDNKMGVARGAEVFGSIISSNHNVLGLAPINQGVCYNEMPIYLIDEGDYIGVEVMDRVVENNAGKYTIYPNQ